MFVCLSVCPCVCVFVCSLFEVPFKRLFVHTSWSRISKIVRYSESLGKNRAKKGSQIWTFLIKNGLKSPQQKKFLYGFKKNCSLLRYRLNVFLLAHSKVGCPKILEIQNPWEKVMERSGLRCEHFCLKMV